MATRQSTKTKRTRAATPAKKKASSRRNARKPSSAAKQIKHTAMQVLAGAAAGAVRAIIPPLEDAISKGAKTAGAPARAPKAGRGKAKR